MYARSVAMQANLGDKLSLIDALHEQTQLLQIESTPPAPESVVGDGCSVLSYVARLLQY